MSAPNLTELFQLERWGEEGFQYGLSTQLVIAPEAINISRQSSVANSPRIELKVTIGEELNHHHLIGNEWMCDTFNGTLEALVVTNRQSVIATDTHYALMGRLRACLKAHYSNIAVNGMPPTNVNPLPWWSQTYISITDIRSAGTTDTWSDDKNLDYSKLSYSLILNIKPDAWPL